MARAYAWELQTMKKIRSVSGWTAGALMAALLGFSMPARAVTVDFSFDNVTGSVAGTVTGAIFGLPFNGTGAATDIEIYSAPATLLASLPALPFSVFTYAANLGQPVTFNSFTLTNGTVTAALFQINGGFFDLNVGGAFNQLTINDYTPGSTFPIHYIGNQSGFAGVSFATTPLPDSLPLFATGLALLGLLAWRRTRTALSFAV